MRRLLLGLLFALLTACGGGGSGPGSGTGFSFGGSGAAPSNPPVATSDAFRFLNQATFGATEDTSRALIALGDSSNAYARWIDAQITKPASLLLPAVEAAYPNPVPTGFNVGSLNAVRLETWFGNVVRGEDQLRQRIAFALSEIFVVSQIGALQNLPNATADFHDMLSRNAFGNYRNLLEQSRISIVKFFVASTNFRYRSLFCSWSIFRCSTNLMRSSFATISRSLSKLLYFSLIAWISFSFATHDGALSSSCIMCGL